MSDGRSGEPIADRPDDGSERAADSGDPPDPALRERRPVLERIGLAAVAVLMAVLFAAVAAASFLGGEYFLAAMGLVGCMMTLAVGGNTLLRG